MSKKFSQKTRQNNIEKLKTNFYDLVIIGGGINGAGVARDAASRGMSVALVEMNDFASGTSSRSSKLIHGGLRYLENLEFHLVYEALSERAKLFNLAPHLVHPLRFLLPMYEGGRVGMFKMGLGMWLYDALSLFESPEMHERLNIDESLDRMPILREEGLKGSYVYSDAYMDDDRLTIETLRSANELGAHCVNYVSAIGADFKNGKIEKLCCRDEHGGSEFFISGKHFVSTVGPWTDELGSTVLKDWKKLMRPSKGIHLTVARKDLPLSCAVVMTSDDDKRIVFGIPRHDMVIIGTTDTDFKGNVSDVRATKEDVNYLLKIVDEYFPKAYLREDKIIASYAGVRPLVDDGAKTESSTSREHTFINDSRNITFVAGGKYTTYRRMAKSAVDSTMSFYSLEDQVRFSKSNTDLPLNSKINFETYGQAFNQTFLWSREFEVSKEETQKLIARHGDEAVDIMESYNLCEKKDLWNLEAHHATNNTMCVNLLDFYLRRSPLFLSEQNHGINYIESIANVFAEKLSWSDAARDQQIKDVRFFINKELAWKTQCD